MNALEHIRAHWVVVIFGSILYIAGVSIIFFNEGHALNVALSLYEASLNAITVDPNEPVSGSQLENRLVYFTGPIICGEPLTEPDYGIEVLAVKLRRRVQMYQWVEEEVEHKFGESITSVQTGDRTYYYSMDWRDELIDSRNFYVRTGHENPTKFPIDSVLQIADHVNIGYYELGNEAKLKITNFIQITSDNRPEDLSLKMHSGFYYHGNDIWNPQVGDLRIIFSYSGLEGDVYTIVGKYHNGIIIPYETSLKVNVLIVHPGKYTLEDAVKVLHHQHRVITWSFRSIGWTLLFFATLCLSRLFNLLILQNRYTQRLAPIFNLIHTPTINNCTILSFSVALLIASIAWIWHRPWVGIGMVCAGLSPYLLCAREFYQYQQRNFSG